MPSKEVRIIVTADLYSMGGQTAVLALGEAVAELIDFTEFGGPVKVEIEANNF